MTMEEELKLRKNEVSMLSELKDLGRWECTPEICAAAVKEYAWALEHVPEEYKTPQMCRHALESSAKEGYGHLLLLPHIPFPEVCMEALQRWGAKGGYELKELAAAIRPEVFNEKMADYLVARNGQCLELLPVHLQTKERAEKAVEVSGTAAILSNRIRPGLKTPDLWLKCAGHSWSSFSIIPWKERSPETCLVAYLKFPDMMEKRPTLVPPMIASRCNVYSLCRLMEQATGEKFSFTQMKEFYEGKPMAVKRMEIPEGFLIDKEVTFDKHSGKFRFAPLRQREEQAQGKQQKEEHKPPQSQRKEHTQGRERKKGLRR